MTTMNSPETSDFFWEVASPLLQHASPLLQQDGVSRSSIMNFPCLRVHGEFFASPEHRNGHLVVKINSKRVSALIENGIGEPFAPAGKIFREWVLIPSRDRQLWNDLLEEALLFGMQQVRAKKRRKSHP